MTEININSFSGANNISEDFYAAKDTVAPKVILNADVGIDLSLTARAGKTLFWNLPGSHSLWAGQTCMLCVANNILYRNISGIATNVGTLSGPKYPFSYIDAEDRVYISSPYAQGIFNPVDNTLSSWGIPLPPGPMILSGDGGLPAGNYHVTMTNVVSGKLSGNGPIADITLTAEGGIQVLNRPAGALVWATDANESIFYLVGAVNKIVDIPTTEPLPTFLCSPPPFPENLCYAFGRIWGSVGTDVYYSMPYDNGLFRLNSNKYHYEDPVTLIAKVSTGLFIGMEKHTRFLAGTIPEQMTEQDAGAGSIRGTLAYCDGLPELGWTLGTPEKDFNDVPVWWTENGAVVGNPSGKFFNVSKNKIKAAIPGRGASLYRNREGILQFLTSFKHGTGSDDPSTQSVFRDGQIDVHSVAERGIGSRAGFSDEVTCTVMRGGVII